jgi:hypothetical protein
MSRGARVEGCGCEGREEGKEGIPHLPRRRANERGEDLRNWRDVGEWKSRAVNKFGDGEKGSERGERGSDSMESSLEASGESE